MRNINTWSMYMYLQGFSTIAVKLHEEFATGNYHYFVHKTARQMLDRQANSSKRPKTVVLTHYQVTDFRLFQTERVCRRQFPIWRKWITVRKHCGKRRNCLLRAISPFPTVFLKGLFPRGVKRCHCMGMG